MQTECGLGWEGSKLRGAIELGVGVENALCSNHLSNSPPRRMKNTVFPCIWIWMWSSFDENMVQSWPQVSQWVHRLFWVQITPFSAAQFWFFLKQMLYLLLSAHLQHGGMLPRIGRKPHLSVLLPWWPAISVALEKCDKTEKTLWNTSKCQAVAVLSLLMLKPNIFLRWQILISIIQIN